MERDDRHVVTLQWDEGRLARGEVAGRPVWIEVDGARYVPQPAPDDRLDRALVENELLREAFSETQVQSVSEEGFFWLHVPRRHWLRLRAWRASDPDHGRAGSRWWRFSYGELQALHVVIYHSNAINVPEHLREPTMNVLDELRAELAARVDEAVGS